MDTLRVKYGQYALVTGSTAGIGAEFASQLAAVGFDLVLVARRKDRLDAIAARLGERHGIRTTVIELDLGAEDAVAELVRRTRHLDVGVVVASAGAVTSGSFTANTLTAESALVQLDLVVPMQMAHEYGQLFAARGRGALVLLASSVGFASSVPGTANYAAAKAYIASLGQALHHELKPRGVDVLTLAPGPTRTEGVENADGIDFSKLPLPLMAPERVVAAALKALGRKPLVIPGGLNRAADALGKYLTPRRAQTAVFAALVGRALTEPVAAKRSP